MEIEFQDTKLALIETDEAPKTKLPFSVIDSLRDKLRFLRGALDERDIRNWKSLHYEKMDGDEHSIRLNKQFRLIFTIDTAVRPNKITVLRVWNHD